MSNVEPKLTFASISVFPLEGILPNITTSLIGLLTIGVGSILIYRNSKKNNEMV